MGACSSSWISTIKCRLASEGRGDAAMIWRGVDARNSCRLIIRVNPRNIDPPQSQQIVPWYGPNYGTAIWASFTNANNLAVGCKLDGVAASCSNVQRAISAGRVGSLTLSTTGGPADFANLGIFVTISPAPPQRLKPPTLKPAMTPNPDPELGGRNPYNIGPDEGLQYLINISFTSGLLDPEPQNHVDPSNPWPREPHPQKKRNPSCDAFTNRLTNLISNSYYFLKSELGIAMMTEAYLNPYEKYMPGGPGETNGFQYSLTRYGQDGDVYRHILFVAGTILTGDGYIRNKFIQYDKMQADRGRQESITELEDDKAGIEVGKAMLDAWNSKNPEKLGQTLHRLICY